MKNNKLTLLCSMVVCLLFVCSAYGQTATDYFDRGTESLKIGDLDDAILNFTKAVERDPKLSAAYNNLALVYQRQGKLDFAISNFSKALELNPSYKEGYFGRGASYTSKGDYDKAIVDLTKAIELDKKYVDAYSVRAHCYLHKNEFAKSMEDVRAMEKLGKAADPKLLEALKKSLVAEK